MQKLLPPLAGRLPRAARTLLIGLFFAPLAGCKLVVMNPHGYIARQQADLIVTSTLLMLIIIVPVILLTLLFAWKYRASRRNITPENYQPDWDHSTKLELLIWGAPLLIILALGAVTWISTHQLDPYRELTHVEDQRPVPAGVKPLEVEVVSLDWKWLFIYPELGIATVNEMAAPVDRPIRFKLTSSTVMNAFYVPELAGMIYTMPGMRTQLNAVINHAGNYEGMSANYSGEGFSGMRFTFRGMDQAAFEQWVADARQAGGKLDRSAYLSLEQPGTKVASRSYANVESGLFDAVLNRCVDSSKPCMNQMMAADAAVAARDDLASLCRSGPAVMQSKRRLAAATPTPANISRPEL